MTESKTVRHIRDTLREGESAFNEGTPCPYKPGEAGFQLWDLGWQAARDEALAAADPLLKKALDPEFLAAVRRSGCARLLTLVEIAARYGLSYAEIGRNFKKARRTSSKEKR